MARFWWQKKTVGSARSLKKSRRHSGRQQRPEVEQLEDRIVPANWSGDLPAGLTTWSSSEVQRITGTVRVPAGSTLVIEPNTVVKFNTFSNFSLLVDGTLTAEGTQALPIIFTSDRDDVREDTNGDGGNSSPANGNWNGLQFNSGSTANVLDHVEVRYGGNNVGGAVLVNGGPLSLTNSTLRHSSSAGLRIQSANPTVTNVVFSNNTTAASMDLGSNPAISGVTMTNNDVNALRLDGGSLVGNGFWDDADIVYLLNGSVTVPQGQSLTVGAGQVIKINEFSNYSLTVNGTLTADGTAAVPIVFTTARDDSVGGDLRNDGQATLQRGEWNGIQFNNTSTANVLDHVEVRYGGNVVGGAVLVNGGPLTLTNSTLRHSSIAGLRIQAASPTVTNVTFSNNNVAASMDLASNPAISGVTMTNNDFNALRLDGGSLVGNGFWDDADIPYLLSGSVTVPQGQSLTVGSGQVVKIGEFSNYSLTVNGTLTADGTVAAPIIFTTARDDSVGGDLRNDGQATLQRGEWNGIQFNNTSTANVLDHVEVRYGGNVVGGAVLVNGGPLTLTNSTLRHSSIAGLRIQAASPTVTNVTFSNNNVAASMDLASNPAISGVTLTTNSYNALRLDSGSLVGNGFWDDAAIPYLLSGSVTVPQGQSLTVGAGQIVKIGEFSNYSLTVNGTLTADGTAAAPIIFTTARDDSAGGDLRNDGQAGLNRGEWNAIQFNSSSTANVLDHVEVRYSGANVGGAVLVNGGPLSLTNSTLRHSSSAGLRIQSANPTVTNVAFISNERAASMDLASNPAFSGATLTANDFNALVLDGGDLVGNRAWDDADIPYLLSGTVNVPAGQTLTVAAGQIVKVNAFSSVGLTVNGTLQAQGTASAPIVFTTARDDSGGGDLRNDGQAALQRGEWEGILFNSSSTASVLDHVEVRYAGNQGGAILANGATLTLENSLLRQSSSHGVLARNGATLQLQSNLIYRNSDTGIRVESNSNVTAINNTIDANFRGVGISGGGTVTLTNNLITNNVRSGVFRDGGGTVNASFNDVFNPGAGGGSYEELADQTGSNANIAVDPKYFNQATSQYQLKAGSPVLDAATSDDAPQTDFQDNPRFDDPNVFNSGSGTIPFFDLGALERQEISTSNIDLATTSVSGPAAGLQDESVTVNWTVKNVGTGLAVGPWRDAVYLSADPVFTTEDLFLGELLHSGDLGPGLAYTASTAVSLPGVLPGDYYFIVRANSRNEVFEGIALLNNPAASAAVVMDLPALTLGTPLNGQLVATGAAKLYKVTTTAGSDLNVVLTGPNGNTNELYVSFGDVPTRQSFDSRGIRPGSANQSVSLGNTQAGTYYILVYGASLPSGETFTLTASTLGFSIGSVSPTQGSNTGQVTVTIAGAQFDGNSQPRLIDSAGGTINPLQMYYTDSGQLSATFDLTGHPMGAADVQVINGGVTQTLSHGFDIVAGQTGRLVTSLSAPSAVRVGRVFAVTINYSNEGDTDLLAPIMSLTASSSVQLSFSSDLSNSANRLDLVGVNPTGPAGVLPPGARGQIPIYATATAAANDNFLLAIGEYPAVPIDWEAISPLLQPASVSSAEWIPFFAQVQQDVGPTWDLYQQTVSADATLLAAGLGLNYSLADVLHLEVVKAEAQLHPAVFGQLFLNDTNHPLGNVALQFHDAANQQYASAVSLTDGTFLVPDMLPGTYTVTATDYILTGSAQLTMGASTLRGVQLVAAPSAALTGSVLLNPGSVPARGVTVSAFSATGMFTATTDNNGLYTIGSLPAGTYDVSAGGAPYTQTTVSGLTLSAGQVQPHVNLVLENGGTISGTVSGPGGVISGATVTAVGADETAFGAVSGVNGAYSIAGLSAQTYSVGATAPGLVGARVGNLSVSAGGTVTSVNLNLTTAGSLSGTVTSAVDGSPADFVFVSVQNAQGQFSAVTDPAGNFQIAGVRPGDYVLTTSGGSFMTTTANVSVVAASNLQLSLVLNPLGTISGAVTATDGQAIVSVVVSLDGPQGKVAETVTSATGMYAFSGLDAGTYQVILGGDAAGIAQTQVVLSGTQSASTTNFVLPRAGVLSGTAFQADSVTPIPDALVVLEQGGQLILTTATDDQGNYAFVILQSGTYQLGASSLGASFAPLGGLVVGNGTSLTGLNFVAGQDEIRGSVSDAATGLPLAGATVYVQSAVAGFVSLGVASLTTAVDGSFAVTGLVPGSYRVTARAAGKSPATQVTSVSGGSPAAVNFALAAESSLTGTIRDAATGLPLTNAVVSLSVPNQTVLGGQVFTDGQGAYQLDQLSAGTFALVIAAPGYETAVIQGVVLNQGERLFNVGLSTGTIAVQGRVLSGGTPLSGDVVTATDANGIVVARATSGPGGSYLLSGLAPGSYTLVASGVGQQPSLPLQVTVTAGQTVTASDLEVTPLAIADPKFPPPPPVIPPALEQLLNRLLQEPQRNSTLDYLIFTVLPTLKADDCDQAIQDALDRLPQAEEAFQKLQRAHAFFLSNLDEDREPTEGHGGHIYGNFLTLRNEFFFPAPDEPETQPSPAQHTLFLDFKAYFHELAAIAPGLGLEEANLAKALLAQLHSVSQALAEGKFLSAQGNLVNLLDDSLAARNGDYLPSLSPGNPAPFPPPQYGADGFAPTIGPLLSMSDAIRNLTLDLIKPGKILIFSPQSYEKLQAAAAKLCYDLALTEQKLNDVRLTGDDPRPVGYHSNALDQLRSLIATERLSNNYDQAAQAAIKAIAAAAACEAVHTLPTFAYPAFGAIGIIVVGAPVVQPPPPDQPPQSTFIPVVGLPEAAPIVAFGAGVAIGIRTSLDPNILTGPAGFGPEGFIQPGTLAYRVDFENDPNKATAAAQIVIVTSTLDPDLDPSTFQFTRFGFGPFSFTVPAGLSHYEITIDLRPDGINLLVPVTLDLNRDTGTLSALFESLDPLTMQPPDGIDDGFLPVNNANHDGEGFFTFTVRPKADLPTGTAIDLQASIVFDINAPILTPMAHNTLDVGDPTSSVAALPARVSTTDFAVNWSGSDDTGGSGIGFFDLFVSVDAGPFTPFLVGTSATAATFNGMAGHRYSFFSVATDNVGHREATPSLGQALTQTPPAAGNDVYAMTKDKALTVVAPGVLANDRAADGGALTVVLVDRPRQGKVTLNPDGSFRYKPKLTAKAPDRFTYRVRDSAGAESDLATVTLLPQVRFASSGLRFSETETTAKLTVKLSIPSTQAVTVAYAVTGGDAANGDDYQLSDGTLTIPAGKSAGKIKFPVINDRLDEPNETIQITLSSPSNALLGTPTVHTYTILDDDPPPRVGFRQAASSGSESTTPVQLEVFLSAASANPVTVNYAAAGGSATDGVDYKLTAGSLTFNPGETSKTIEISVMHDSLPETKETVRVKLAQPGNATLGTLAQHTFTILDDDALLLMAASFLDRPNRTVAPSPTALDEVFGRGSHWDQP